MFGCTHVCAIDGRSGMIVSFVTMPIKNNVIIYDNLFKWEWILFMFLVTILPPYFVGNCYQSMVFGSKYEWIKERNGI